VCLLLSGVFHSMLISYPFLLEREGELLYFFIQIIISLIFTRLLFLLELGVGQLNQSGILECWGEMVPILRGITTMDLKNNHFRVFVKSITPDCLLFVNLF